MDVMIMGWFGHLNAGDDAILYAETKILKEILGEELSKIKILSFGKVLPPLDNGINAFFVHFKPPGGIRDFLKEAKTSDIFILGGGGFLFELVGARIPKNLLYYALPTIISKKIGMPTLGYGLEVGRPRTNLGKLLLKMTLRNMDLTVVRDGRSFDVARTVGGDKLSERIRKTVDITFSQADVFSRMPKDQNFDLRDYLVLVPTSPKLSISRGAKLTDKEGNEITRKIALMLKTFLERVDLNVAIIPFQCGVVDPSDRNTALQIKRELRRELPLDVLRRIEVKVYDSMDFRHKISAILESTITVGMRLHSLIFATFGGIPMLGMDYSSESKVKVFMEELGIPSKFFDLRIASPKEMAETLMNILDNHKDVSNQIKRRYLHFKQVSQQNSELLKDFLSDL